MQYIDFKTSGAQTASATGDSILLTNSFSSALFVLDVTAAATDVGDLLDVYIDFSGDGTSWINAIHFTQVLGNGGAKKEMAKVNNDLLENPDAVITIATDCASSVVRNTGVLPYVRYRSAITDVGTDDASFTYSVKGFFTE